MTVSRTPIALAAVLTACGGDGSNGADQSGSGGFAATAGASGASVMPAGGGATSRGGTTSPFGGAGTATSLGGGGTVTGGAGSSSSGGAPSGGGSASGGTSAGGGSSGFAGAVPPGGTSGGGGSSSGGAFPFGGAGGAETSLPNGVAYLYPPPGGMGVCVDAPVRIRFAVGAPTMGSSGKISVHDSSGAVVASLDLGAATTTGSIGGTTFTIPRRAFVDGNDAVFYVKGAFAYGKTYYVTVDAGAVSAPGASGFAVTDSSTWRFSTKAAAPSDGASYGVALDGTGDYCTVQGALDAVPANNTTPRTITIAPGTYHEIIHVRGKNRLTLHGVDRKTTIIAGTNNNDLNPSTATRSLVGFDSLSGLLVENLTIHNTTPQGGSQAEALRLEGCDQCVVRDADILSLQDTLLWSGRVYAKNCHIAGNVDYVWGAGVVYFDSCEIRTVGRSGVIVQSRNAAGAYGYVFVDSKLTADAAATSNMLARVDASAFPGSHVAFIDCEMQNIAPSAWTITGAAPTSTLRFWEYGSHDAAGNPVNVGQRASGSTQISASQAATMRDVVAVLGGWKPSP